MSTPSITELSKYLTHPWRNVAWKYSTTSVTEDGDELYNRISYRGRSFLAVVCYVLKFCSNSQQLDDHKIVLIDTIKRLNDLVSGVDWQELQGDIMVQLKDYEDEDDNIVLAKDYIFHLTEMEREVSEIIVAFFMPKVEKFFNVSYLKEELSERGSISTNPIMRNEILAGFINFLLQILNSHVDDQTFTDQYDPHIDPFRSSPEGSLQSDLTFLLAYLGDTPIQETELDDVENLLEDFEVIANGAGSFIYSQIFTFPPLSIFLTPFFYSREGISEKVEILNAKIVEHCNKFSMKFKCVTSETTCVDSLFIVDSLLEDLSDIMSGRVDWIPDIKDQLRPLHQVLVSTRSFLKEINTPHDSEIDELREYLVRIRDLGYEAEYLINSFVVRNVPNWYLNLRLPHIIQKFELIATGYDELKMIYGVKVSRHYEDSTADVPPSHVIESSMVDDIVVGFDKEIVRTLGALTGEAKNLQIISIFGMPGLGKTTLAKTLYNHRRVIDYFDVRAWCVVSQTYNKRKVFIDLLMSSPSKPDEEILLNMDDESLAIKMQETLSLLNMDYESLGNKSHKTLTGRRYLIVLDDVWSSEVWDDLRRYFPDNKNGSRIMFTSQIQDIVPIGSIIQTLPLLRQDQCWELLEKKVFGLESCPSQLVDTGKQIATRCIGLPLAVVVIAGILSNMENEESAWKEVEESLDFHISNCMKILELSYKYLPDHLKLCFLYFGVFPEDMEIPVKKLIQLWVAEGFIPQEGENSLENVAKHYLMELINRSLVLIARKRSIGGAKACSIHDLLRDMCLRKAQEENFLNEIKENHFLTKEKYHRLSVNSAAQGYVRPFSPHCRSFLGHLSDPSSCLPQMKLLRVMELSQNKYMDTFCRLTNIDDLVYLRYLVVDRMPAPIVGYLINLEFLRIDRMNDSVMVPSIILKMPKLKHLHIRLHAQFYDYCDSSHTNNLETLSFVFIYTIKDYEILSASPYLRKLNCLSKPLLPDLHFLTELESLKIVVLDTFQIPNNPTEIYFPSTIKKLSLSGICLPWERMSIIGAMPKLQVLKLHMNAFDGEEWETSEEGFQELRFLKLDSLNLESWIASNEHFPTLRHLVLHKCDGLQSIPTELGDIATLVMIEVHHCGYEASISAVQIEEEQLEYGNEELKVIITNYEWSKEQLLQKYREES